MPKNKSKQKKSPKGRSSSSKPIIPKSKRGGKVEKDWNIQWTRSTAIFYSLILGVPYLIAIIATILKGIYFFTGVLILIAALVGFVFAVVRWLDRADF